MSLARVQVRDVVDDVEVGRDIINIDAGEGGNVCSDGGKRGNEDDDASEMTGLLMQSTKNNNTQMNNNNNARVLTLSSLVMLTFFTVSGGPVGSEGAFAVAGPLAGFAALLIFPWIYSVPVAFVAAEMATLFPDDGGYTVWVNNAFGPFWAFQEGYWSWISGVIDNSMYPVLVIDIVFPRSGSAMAPFTRWLLQIIVACAFSVLNFMGLKIGGRALIGLGLCVMVPYVFFVLVGFSYVNPAVWFTTAGARDGANSNSQEPTTAFAAASAALPAWIKLLNVVFWNYSGWDGVSTFAGEVKNPTKSYPRALTISVLLVTLSYVLPMLVAVGAAESVPGMPPFDSWEDGTIVEVGALIGGSGMRNLLIFSSLCSAFALFSTELFVDSYLLLGMSEQRLVPQCFRSLSKRYRAPYAAIISSMVVMGIVMWFLDFAGLMHVNNILSGLSILLELIAATHLRWRYPDMVRPYNPPCASSATSYFLVLVLCPAAIICILICGSLLTQSSGTTITCAGMLFLGIAFHALMHSYSTNGSKIQ